MQLKYTFLLSALLLILGAISQCSTHSTTLSAPRLRAAWVQSRSIRTPETVDEMLARVETGKFTAIFVEAFVYGRANYNSALLEKSLDLAPDFDPLAYVLEQAHRRGIQVHVWLIGGPVGGLDGPILSRRPDWAMRSLDGERANWLNYNRPDVRQFISDIALEIVRNYKVDGIHFDYTRYPSPGGKWGFDSYSVQLFAQEADLDPALLRYADLPAYGTFGGNALSGPITAQVLAEFGSGRPAILLNRYGAGQVILFNWEADERQIAASSEILRRSIDYLGNDEGQLYILQSETNAQKYGWSDFKQTFTWLNDIGQTPLEVTEGNLATLEPGDILLMPSVYLIDAPVAAELANLVYQGLGVIFIDGPTPSISDANVQAITGMSGRGGSFQETGLLLATQPNDLIPSSNRSDRLEDYQLADAQWTAFRAEGINQLLESVYHRLKQEAPQVLVTITVAADQDTLAKKHFLDWQAWLAGQYVDLIIPRAYVAENEALAPVIAPWRSTLNTSNQVMLGLSVYARRGSQESKPLARLLAEIEEAYASNSNGVILFDQEGIKGDALPRLANGPFSMLVTRDDP